MNYQSTFLEAAPGVKLHITDAGAGKPIVFIHGWPFSDAIFRHQYNLLTGQGYRVIGITLRGFGESDKPETGYDFGTYAADIHKVITVLKLKDAVLAGYSMGGAIAVQYLANYPADPISQLVLFSSNVPLIIQKNDFPYGFTPESFERVIEMSIHDRQSLIDVYGPLFNLDETFMPMHLGAGLNAIAQLASPSAVTDSLRAMMTSDLRPFLPGIRIPVLLLHAQNDNAIPFAIAEYAHRHIPGSTLVSFEKGGHWIFIKEAEKFHHELLRFIGHHTEKKEITVFGDFLSPD